MLIYDVLFSLMVRLIFMFLLEISRYLHEVNKVASDEITCVL